MRTPVEAVSYVSGQHASGAKTWSNGCERLARTAYGLAAHYEKAEDHAKAVPAAYRYAHQPPDYGDLILIRNGGYGHIAICTGTGWQGWSNDYGGRGTVSLVKDVRRLVAWCGGYMWYIADAWWSASHKMLTHVGPTPSVRMTALLQRKSAGDHMTSHELHVIAVWKTDGIEIA